MNVTVITSSIGRKELRQTIESVRAQTYPCRHYVYVNGSMFHDRAREILNDYPQVTAIYLPENTGDYGVGASMADVFAAASFLTTSDWIFYLNDDDFYDTNHVESIMTHIKTNKLLWAYSLRKFVNIDGSYVCDDNWCNLGHWAPLGGGANLVDNSCYAIHRSLAIKYGRAWTAMPYIADRCFLSALMESKAPYGSPGLYTVNYRLGTGTATDSLDKYLKCDESAKAAYPDGFPWQIPSVFNVKR